MAFWSRKASPQPASETENPYRAIDPAAFDRGAMINDLADHLRRIASGKLQGSDVVAALQTALGAEIAALIARKNPNAGPDSLRYIMEQVFGTITDGVREAAYMAANLPEPEPYGERDLTEEEFNELTNRVVNAATQNNVRRHVTHFPFSNEQQSHSARSPARNWLACNDPSAISVIVCETLLVLPQFAHLPCTGTHLKPIQQQAEQTSAVAHPMTELVDGSCPSYDERVAIFRNARNCAARL